MVLPTPGCLPAVAQVLDDLRGLADPVVVAAFEGWNDAGDAASGAVEHLHSAWDGVWLAEVDPEDYYDFQVSRPRVSLVEGRTRELVWPTTRLAVCRPEGAGRDVLLVHGLEPNMRWRSFCNELLSAVTYSNASTVITLGALLADIPHTRPVHVSGTVSDDDMAARMGLSRSRYEGPTGITGVFQDAVARAGIGAVSLWAAVPHYVSTPPCPKATLALLDRIEDLTEIAVPAGDLPEQALAWERTVDELAREDSEVAEYVTQLEQREAESDLPEASGEAIARAFERYLRRGGS